MSNLGLNILILEDNDERIARAKQLWPACTVVTTAAACIKKLQEREWVTLLLDHDLGGEVYVDSSREDCGMEVVRWLVANKINLQECVIHSHNSPAAAAMHQQLSKADYKSHLVPFGTGFWKVK